MRVLKRRAKLQAYLSEARRHGLTQNGVYLAESAAAGRAGDEETAWAWLALADLLAYSLMSCKKNLGADGNDGGNHH